MKNNIKRWQVVELLGTQNPNVEYSTIIEFHLEEYNTEEEAKLSAEEYLKLGRNVEVMYLKHTTPICCKMSKDN